MAVAVRPTTQRRPREAESQQPLLTLVPESGFTHWKIAVVAVCGLFAMLAIVTLNVAMAQQQMRLDRLNSDVYRARAHFEELRADRAQLQSPGHLMKEARAIGLVPAMATKTVNIPASIAAEVAATVGKIDADMTTHSESPLDKFGRLKAVVVGNP